MSSLREIVRSSLDTAVDENGYTELLTLRPEKVVIDLSDCDSEIASHKGWRYLHELVPHVKEWQADRAAQAVKS